MKKNHLNEPHIKPLTELVKQWRAQSGYDIPFFDPDDGGVNAQMLFLLEKPGPKSATNGGSGFISQDNEDPTARAIKEFMTSAHIPRSKIVLWNAIAAWNGTRTIKQDELTMAPKHLAELFSLLQEIRVIVLVGKRAERVFHKLNSATPEGMTNCLIERSIHPGQQNRNRRYLQWLEIPRIWERAARSTGIIT